MKCGFECESIWYDWKINMMLCYVISYEKEVILKNMCERDFIERRWVVKNFIYFIFKIML